MLYHPVAMRANPTVTISGGTSSNIGGSGVRYDTPTGFAYNIGPSSNGMCYVGGSSSPATMTAAIEL